MRILLATSEVFPYSKSGGLADMTGALAKFLARAGHEVGLVTPMYRGMTERFPQIRPYDWALDLPLGPKRVQGRVRALKPIDGLTIYFIEQKEFFDRDGLYGYNGVDYPDNAERFIFFSKCVANLARYMPWKPELVHVHDWQAALVPLLLRDEKKQKKWAAAPPVCLTIHNLAYQGNFPREKYALTNLPFDYFNPDGVEFYQGMNCLKAGIIYADLITTVSPRYAREITTEMFGCGLDGVLRRRQEGLAGILNGVDYEEWKTEGNSFLKHSYSVDDLSGKAANKFDLQKEMGLRPDPDVPLFGTVARLAAQKGGDIQLGALEEMLAANLQFVLLGAGDGEFERGYIKLARRYPGKCAVVLGYNAALAHRIEAGCDFFLMPSRFEPCGLNQMYSLRYGTVPIVRMTGGLDDSVIDISEDVEKADGIKFSEYSARALAKAMRKAFAIYADKELLLHYRQNGMAKDFSWHRTAVSYELMYKRLLAGKPARVI